MIDEAFETRQLSDSGISISDFKARMGHIVDNLSEEPEVIVNNRNRPVAVFVDLQAYRAMKEQASAYQHLQLLEEAEAEQLDIDELATRVDAATANRRASRVAQAA